MEGWKKELFSYILVYLLSVLTDAVVKVGGSEFVERH